MPGRTSRRKSQGKPHHGTRLCGTPCLHHQRHRGIRRSPRHGSHAHLLVAVVEDAVVLPHEDIAHDPQGAAGRRHIDSHEGKEALAGDAEDVVGCAQCEGLAAQDDLQVRQGGNLAAVDDVLLASNTRGPNLLGHGRNHIRRPRDQRGAAVDDGLRGRRDHGGASEGHGVEAHLPVGLAGQRNVDEVAGVMALINTAEDQLAILPSR
mmetsp:Transcript_43656/g.98504  ORF Transcript_43656/g.98504 Transcript_43656/m.98504 type:complete len:207 (+) Transcript_43656:62-682(+)